MKTEALFARLVSVALGCIAAVAVAYSQAAPPANSPASRSGQSPAPVAPRTADEVVELNPFEVTAGRDNSYGALNSNSITSFRVELDRIPVSADVFSKTFMDDIGAMEVEDMVVNYATGAGITSGSGSPSSAASVNQPLDRGGGSIALRGLATGGYPLRNGFFPVTSNGVGFTTLFDLDRVEVISGPQSLLYGAGGGGGVINYVSKQAKFNSAPTTELMFRVDHYGNKAGTADFNVGGRRLAIRAALINQQVLGRRENIGGNMVGGYTQLAAKPFNNTTVRMEYERTSYTRLLSNSFTVTGVSNANDSRNGQKLRYLLATDQINAPASGPNGLGAIANGHVNWENVDSFGGDMLAEIRRMEFVTAQVDTVWARWLSTRVAGGYTDLESTKIGNVGCDFLAPSVAANPLRDWAVSMKSSQTTATDLWQPAQIKNLRVSALITNDLFGNRAHSQTVLGGDFMRSNSGGGGLGYYYVLADGNFNPIISPAVNGVPPQNNGYTNIPVQYWSVGNGPIKYPLWGTRPDRVTVGSQNYVLTMTNAPVPGKQGPDNPLSLSGYSAGTYRPNRKVQKGVYFANFTNWLENRLTTLFGVRANNVNTLSYTENSSTNKLAIPSTVSETDGTAVDFSFGVTYHLRPNLRPYIAVSDAYSPPSSTSQDPYGRAQKAMKSIGGEIGVKISSPSGNLSGSLAYFRANAKNEQTSFDVSIRDMINPSGLNGRVGIAPSSIVSLDRTSEGVQATVTANPSRHWRMRASVGYQQALVKSGGSYDQLYNDQFYANNQGQVTYKDGTVVYVSSTATRAMVAAAGTVGAVPLTITMMSTPAATGAPNPYYANPVENSGAIRSSSGAAVILQGTNSYFPTSTSTTGTTDPNLALHGPILTGAIGLPISQIQIRIPAGVNGPIGAIPIARAGERPQGSPGVTFNYESMYSFEEGWLKGFKIGGIYQGGWKHGSFYYYPNTLAKDPNTRTLFQWPTKCIITGILGYDWKWRRTRVSTQVNVSNMFNRYHVVILPNYTAGYAGVCDATFDQQPRSYVWSTRFNF